jgi:hypothetical protein
MARRKKKRKGKRKSGGHLKTHMWKSEMLDRGISPDGLPIKPFPPGPSLGIIGGGPKQVPYKERFMITIPGWYRWYECFLDDDKNIVEREGWFRVARRDSDGQTKTRRQDTPPIQTDS